MSLRSELRQQYDIIGSLQPATHVPQNWNYEIPSSLYRAYMHPPHDVGGQRDVPLQYEEKEEEQWELNTYVTCEVLAWRGIWNACERRRRARELCQASSKARIFFFTACGKSTKTKRLL